MHYNQEYKRSLSIVFYIHVAMFFIVLTAGLIAHSTAVLADSLDFIGDAANYALSFYVLNKSMKFRSYAAILKAITMLCGSVPVFIYASLNYKTWELPNYEIMTASGSLGILSHIICIYYLHKFRKGDSNLLSVWVCTINDLISNVLIILASILVAMTNSMTPDIFVAGLIVGLAIFGACAILRKAIIEIKMVRCLN